MNIPQKISKDSFPSLWETVIKEGRETKKIVRINRAIAIFSQIFFAISVFMFGCIVFSTIFKNDSSELLFFEYIETKIISLFPGTLPTIAIVIICLVLTIVIPVVCCLLIRVVFSLLGAKYKNNDIGKDGLAGAKAIEKAINEFKEERKHYDITWDLPEIWVYNLIFSISFILPMIIQLYISADKTAEGITSFIFMAILFVGLGGLILLLPVIGLKAISNFLCNQTCVFLKKSKEKEYLSLIKALSDYISSAEKQIKAEEKAQQKLEEKRKQEKVMQDMIDGEKLYNEIIASDPVNEELMKEAAKLGSVSACYYLGKKLLLEWLSDMYTAEEKKQIAKDAANYFDAARLIATMGNLDNKTECEFLWLYSRLQYESNTKGDWKEMLNAFRVIQKSGELNEEYSETLELAIKTVVSTIDSIDQDDLQPTNYNEPPKTLYCKFRNGAICTKNSNSAMIYHCNYVNSPAICPTARAGGLELR